MSKRRKNADEKSIKTRFYSKFGESSSVIIVQIKENASSKKKYRMVIDYISKRNRKTIDKSLFYHIRFSLWLALNEN